MGGNTVSGAGGSKDPKDARSAVQKTSTNSEEIKLMQLQQQRENISKQIQKQFSKNDGYDPLKASEEMRNQQMTKLADLEKQIEARKARLEKQLERLEGQRKAEENLKTKYKETGFMSLYEKKVILTEKKAALEKEIIEKYASATPEEKAELELRFGLEYQKKLIEKELLEIENQEKKDIKAEIYNYSPKYTE